MKKITSMLAALFVLGLITMIATDKVWAIAQNTTNGQTRTAPPSPTGNRTLNQNQVTTQNQGEETNLQVSTQEQESSEEGTGVGLENKNPNAVEHMSIVAQKVQELLQVKTSGGIGDRVRLIARTQNQAQDQIQEQLNEIESKSKLAKSLFGPDYKSLKNLQQQVEQNQLRIQELQQLMTQLSNQGDKTAIQETIQALTQENVSLQEIIASEEQIRSLFGWLVKLFAN